MTLVSNWHHWHWPQWTEIALIMIMVFVNISNHGKPRVGNYNAIGGFLTMFIVIFILTAGGFFA